MFSASVSVENCKQHYQICFQTFRDTNPLHDLTLPNQLINIIILFILGNTVAQFLNPFIPSTNLQLYLGGEPCIFNRANLYLVSCALCVQWKGLSPQSVLLTVPFTMANFICVL